MMAETQQALQLALTAGAGDIATGTLVAIRRRRAAQPEAGSPAALAADLANLSWTALSALLVHTWMHLGYVVEITDIGPAGVVDFILHDQTGYTYVSARRWRVDEVTSVDIKQLHEDMALVNVTQGVWLAGGRPTQKALHLAGQYGIRLIGADELAIMVERSRRMESARPN